MNMVTNHRPGIDTDIATIIALDFDGVLHPASHGPSYDDIGNGTLLHKPQKMLDHMEMFCALIVRHPDTRIVLSTSWRHHIKHEELCSYFTPPVRRSIIGCTPIDSHGNRRMEIGAMLHFMRLNGYTGRLLVLDDTSTYFQSNDFIGFKSVSDDCWGMSFDMPTVYLTNSRRGLTHFDIAFLDIILSQSSNALKSQQSDTNDASRRNGHFTS